MKIGYVLKRYPRYSETFIVAELLAHQAAGLEVEIFALKDPNDPCRQPAVARVWYPVEYPDDDGDRSDREARQASWLAERARRRGIDLLHAHFATAATSVARRAAALAGIPFTFTTHAKDIYHADVDQAELVSKIEAAARVVTVSEFNRAYLTTIAAGARRPEDRIVRIYNGIDLEEYPARLGPGRLKRVLAVGRLVEKKGFADLIDAIALLARRGSPFHCDIVGAGPLEPSLRARVAELGVADLIHFHGALARERVAEMLRVAGVFVAPCVIGPDGDRDGLPTVLLEAMASGTPVIATPVTGIPELIDDGATGWLVPSHAPGSVATVIAKVLQDPQRSLAVAAAARARIERDFDLARTSRALRATFAAAILEAHALQEAD